MNLKDCPLWKSHILNRTREGTDFKWIEKNPNLYSGLSILKGCYVMALMEFQFILIYSQVNVIILYWYIIIIHSLNEIIKEAY